MIRTGRYAMFCNAGPRQQIIFLFSAMLMLVLCSRAFAGWTPLPPWQEIGDVANARCSACHGTGGAGNNPQFPKLAGQNAGYLFLQIQNFHRGIRSGPVMYYQLSDLKIEDMAALAQHFAGLPRPPAAPRQSSLEVAGKKIFAEGMPDTGMEACSRCHGVDGRGGGAMPRLAGQHARYVAEQLNRFRKGTRVAGQTPEHPIAKTLTDEDILAVSLYVATLP